MNDRQSAFKILNKIEKDRAYTNLLLDSYLKSNADNVYSTSFVTALVYGVTERLITLDYILSKYLRQPIKKLKPEVLTILRMGAYQLKFMDSVPNSAAVNESVKLAKNNGCAFASGLVNSVLRKVSADKLEYPKTDDPVYDMSIRYSCPYDLVSHYCKDYGEENAEGILSCSIGEQRIFARVNTLKTDFYSLKRSLDNEKTEISPCENIENHFEFKTHCAVERLPQFLDGLFHVQDIASAICVKSLELDENMTFIDVCSAPGGKTFTAAQYMKNKGKIYAFDLYEHRVKLISEGAERLGIDIISAQQGDALSLRKDLIGTADRVLCDVPCSGLGVIGKKPEIRYKNLDLIDKLTQTQYNILIDASEYLKPDGLLVYSTCSLNKAENEDVCDRFLSEHSNFEKHKDYLTLFPHINNSDGFFIAVFRRI